MCNHLHVIEETNTLPQTNCEDDQWQPSKYIVFSRDLALTQHPSRLHLSKDLAEITVLVQNRKRWRGLASQISEAAAVSQTKNWNLRCANVLRLIRHLLDGSLSLRPVETLSSCYIFVSSSLWSSLEFFFKFLTGIFVVLIVHLMWHILDI